MRNEKDIERKLVTLISRYGGRCLKWNCPGWRGVPDRICLFPGGHVIFVEVKRPLGGKVAPMQEWWCNELKRMGFLHYFIFDEASLDSMEAFLLIWTAERFTE